MITKHISQELHQLFLDMQTMVEMQQETITNIEKISEHAVYDLEKGTQHVSVAVKTAKITRKVSVVKRKMYII